MQYDKFISYLSTILQTGIENVKLAEDKRNIHTSLNDKLIAVEKEEEKVKERKALFLDINTTIYDCFKDSEILPLQGETITISELFKKSGDIAQKPFIIAGPMVRNVDTDSATIWIALSVKQNISVHVYEDNNGAEGAVVLSGNAVTVALGKFVHVVAITAKGAEGRKLEYGKTYLYNLKFENQDDLKKYNTANELSYLIPDSAYSLPSFMLPPNDMNGVHIIHSSCRNMGNIAYDSMPALDTLIEKSWKTNRPQQMYLSGDQVYADEGSEILEHLYTNTGNKLMWEPGTGEYSAPENIKISEEGDAKVCPADLIPGERGDMNKLKQIRIGDTTLSYYDILKKFLPNPGPEILNPIDYIHDVCGFTPTSRFHVFSLADFFGLYLLTWSDLLWPDFFKNPKIYEWASALSIANKQEVKENLLSRLTEINKTLEDLQENYFSKISLDPPQDKINADLAALSHELFIYRTVVSGIENLVNAVVFVSGLKKVRRALANISTYMIFDDHEITDDWHMTREWVHRAYSMPMGRRVLQNGMAAYAVFQAWGNTPSRFDSNDSAGRKLLDALSGWITQNYSNEVLENTIANQLKIPNKTQVKDYRNIGKDNSIEFPSIFQKPVEWHFQYSHPKYEVLVLDTRTVRSFPGSLYSAPDPLNAEGIKNQLPEPAILPAPFNDKLPEVSFVISPCNIVTIPLFRNFMSGVLLPMAQYLKNYRGSRWNMTAYDPDQSDSWEIGTPVFEAFLSRMAVRSYKINSETKRSNKVVILSGDVHFTFSGRLAYWADKPFKTTEKKEHEMVVAHLTASGMKNETGVWKTLKLDLIGYEFTDTGTGSSKMPDPEIMVGYSKKPESLNKEKVDEITLRTRWFPDHKPSIILNEPLILPNHKMHPDVKIPKPEWMYRIDFVRGEKVTKVKELNEFSHFDFAREQSPSSEIVRRSNFASITLDWEGEAKLKTALNIQDEKFSVVISDQKLFPQPPFFIIIDNEILYVTAVLNNNEQEMTLTAKRGKGTTVAAGHVINSIVKIRQCVTQTNWMVLEPKKNDPIKLNHLPLTSFKVAMGSEDLEYSKPQPNII